MPSKADIQAAKAIIAAAVDARRAEDAIAPQKECMIDTSVKARAWEFLVI